MLIDLWYDIRYVGKLCFYAGKRLMVDVSAAADPYFGIFRNDDEYRRAYWALLIVVVICSAALAALVRRVRAVEIVS